MATRVFGGGLRMRLGLVRDCRLSCVRRAFTTPWEPGPSTLHAEKDENWATRSSHREHLPVPTPPGSCRTEMCTSASAGYHRPESSRDPRRRKIVLELGALSRGEAR